MFSWLKKKNPPPPPPKKREKTKAVLVSENKNIVTTESLSVNRCLLFCFKCVYFFFVALEAFSFEKRIWNDENLCIERKARIYNVCLSTYDSVLNWIRLLLPWKSLVRNPLWARINHFIIFACVTFLGAPLSPCIWNKSWHIYT